MFGGLTTTGLRMLRDGFSSGHWWLKRCPLRHQLPAIGAERCSGQVGAVEKIAFLRVVDPAETHSLRIAQLWVRDDHAVINDACLSRQEDLRGVGNRETEQGQAPGLQALSDIGELQFNPVGLSQHALQRRPLGGQSRLAIKLAQRQAGQAPSALPTWLTSQAQTESAPT